MHLVCICLGGPKGCTWGIRGFTRGAHLGDLRVCLGCTLGAPGGSEGASGVPLSGGSHWAARVLPHNRDVGCGTHGLFIRSCGWLPLEFCIRPTTGMWGVEQMGC